MQNSRVVMFPIAKAWVYLRLAAPPRLSCRAMIHDTHSIPSEDQRQYYEASNSRMNVFGLYLDCKCSQKSIDSIVLRRRAVVVDTAEYQTLGIPYSRRLVYLIRERADARDVTGKVILQRKLWSSVALLENIPGNSQSATTGGLYR